MRLIATLLALCALTGCVLAGCAPDPLPARAALWEVTAQEVTGQEVTAQGLTGRGWLFGTIHALPQPADWQTPIVKAALEQSDLLVLEVAQPGDDGATQRIYAQLAHSPGQAPLAARVSPHLRPALSRLLKSHGLSEQDFATEESWAAAIHLSQLAQPQMDSDNGIDRALRIAAKAKPVAELEGAAAQLRIFDSLPPDDQRALLDAAVTGADQAAADAERLTQAWRTGDMAVIARETNRGLLSDPELRAALFTQRNVAWGRQVAQMISQGRQPFVAVGAAHMAGPDGLPALLAAQGYRVRRIQ